MTDGTDIRDLLVEIRDNQRLSLQRQEEHLAIAKQQVDRARNQVQESIELHRQAIERVERIARIAVPGIVFCVVLISLFVDQVLLRIGDVPPHSGLYGRLDVFRHAGAGAT